MSLLKNQKGISHHFLLPLLAILAVGAIGAYMLQRTRAAVDTSPTTFKVGLVDDGDYASTLPVPFTQVHDYLTGGADNPYAFAITKGGMRHVVVNVGLNELLAVDPTTRETTYIEGSLRSRIDNAIKWNAANPTQKLTVHLRFHVGGRAPEAWKQICGSVNMSDPHFANASAVAPRWWVEDEMGNNLYLDLYQRAMNVLAEQVALINNDPETLKLIGTVNAPGAAPNYPEPMIIYAGSATARSNLMAAGFNAALHNKFMLAFPKASGVFTNVGVELAINPYQNLDAYGNYTSVNATMYQDVARELINTVGASRTVIANYSARQAYTRTGTFSGYGPMYSWMSEMAKAADPVWVGVQMARPHNVAEGDSDTNEQWDDVARWAASKGFNFAETTGPRSKSLRLPAPHGYANIWPASYHDDSDDIRTLQSITSAFAANHKPGSSGTGGTGTLPATKGYVTVMWDGAVWQAAARNGCSDSTRTRTLLQNAKDLKAKNLFGVGGVIVGQISDTRNQCIGNNLRTSSWANLATLRDGYKWRFISQGMRYADMATMTTDEARYNESGATLSNLAAKGHKRAWGAFNYAGSGAQNSAAQTVVSKSFAFGRLYGSGLNTKESASVFPYPMSTYPVGGGRCNNSKLACYNLATTHRRTSSLTEVTKVLSPAAGKWGVVQFNRLVEGKYGSMGQAFAWDCTSSDWKNRWTSQQELYCRESFLQSLNARTGSAISVDPATIAEAWGSLPTARR